MKKISPVIFAVALAATLSFGCKKEETTNTTASDTAMSSTESTSSSSETTGSMSTDTTGTAMSTDTSATAATTTVGTKLEGDDQDFVEKTAKGGLAEVEISQDALTKATNPDVKAFAQKMVDDHTAANNELTQFAAGHGITLPTEVSVKGKQFMEKVAKLTGNGFDKAYMNQMVEDHKETVDAFQKMSAKAKDSGLKAWIDKTLPTLQGHLKDAQDLNAKLPKK